MAMRRDIEVLGKIKLSDGDAFCAGDDRAFYPPVPKIDREAHR
jgi:hypothetical protein